MADERIKNIYYMLSYAFRALRERGYADIAAEQFDHIHDLLATIFIRGVSAQIKRGLYKDYVLEEEPLALIRGRIQVAETIKQQTLSKGRLVCEYDEFTPDSPHNRALKCVMLLLIRHGSVTLANKKMLKKLLLYLMDVTEVAPQAIRWDAMKYNKNNASYRMLIGVCQLIVKDLLLTEEKGSLRLSAWLQDEYMYRLYERFVLSYYAYHYPQLSPGSEIIDWDIDKDTDQSFLPQMRTDITLKNDDKRMIIDTKFYGKTMHYNAQYGDRMTFISANLYQILAYVKNSDIDCTGKVSGVLLYAATDEDITPDMDYIIGGNRICLKTLDLRRDWEGITDQLNKTIEPLLQCARN